jgi:hypothetical protein
MSPPSPAPPLLGGGTLKNSSRRAHRPIIGRFSSANSLADHPLGAPLGSRVSAQLASRGKISSTQLAAGRLQQRPATRLDAAASAQQRGLHAKALRCAPCSASWAAACTALALADPGAARGL